MIKYLKPTITLLVSFYVLKSNAQTTNGKEDFLTKHEAGIYVGSYFAKGENLYLTPQAWIYFNDLYIEARYNYEDIETASVHFGKSILLNNEQLELIPAAGLIIGNYNGLSAGLNINYETEKISGFTQTQYCFSFSKSNEPFYFSWLGLSAPVHKGLSAGASWQWLAQKAVNPEFDYGPMISYKKGVWGLELYAYNPWKIERYWQAAFYIDLSLK